MTENDPPWRQWPALADVGTARRWRFQCAHGVWGKEPATSGDSHWVAASADFDAESRRHAQALYLGSEDDLTAVLLWCSANDAYQAAHCYPSRFTDSANRLFLERQVVELRDARRLPAALAALALLTRAGDLTDGTWRDRVPDPVSGLARNGTRGIERLNIHIDEFALAELIAAGCRDLAQRVDTLALAAMYAGLLADNRFVPLPETPEPLTPSALAVLLLPLERRLADTLSLLSRLPSTRVDPERLAPGAEAGAVQWHLLGRGKCAPALLPPPTHQPTDELRQVAAAMARALLDNNPAAVCAEPGTGPRAPRRTQREADGAHEIRIWGSASAGKTAYLAQLFTKLDHGGDPDWSVRLPPAANQEWFKGRLDDFQKQNRFPEATPWNTNDQLAYRFVNERTGRRATIAIEDRPGGEYEQFNPETAQRLAEADGLLLLLDPMSAPAKQNDEVQRAFLAMQQKRRDDGKDPRPLAVCVSKCDEYIGTLEDYRDAKQRPEVFLRERIGKTIADALAHYFDNYRLFALSAAGLRIHWGLVEPSVFYDEALELRINSQGQPMNLIEPLVWLIAELGP